MVTFEQGLKCNQGVNGMFVLGRRLIVLGEDPVAVINGLFPEEQGSK